MARADLFDRATVVVTPTKHRVDSAVDRVTTLWRTLGARLVVWDAVVLDRSVLRNFARAVGDGSDAYRRANDVPAPPTFTFAAPYGSSLSTAHQPPDPSAGRGNPMHAIMGELYAKGALVLHGEQEFDSAKV